MKQCLVPIAFGMFRFEIDSIFGRRTRIGCFASRHFIASNQSCDGWDRHGWDLTHGLQMACRATRYRTTRLSHRRVRRDSLSSCCGCCSCTSNYSTQRSWSLTDERSA